jgi:outer membrane receptor protein involved in Fe transport
VGLFFVFKKYQMKYFNLFLYFTLCLSFLNAQNGFIRGTVLDESNGETLIGVSVVLQGTTNGAMTDLDGQFSITAQPGTYNVQVSYISYQTIVIEDVVVSAGQTNKLSTIVLKESALEIGEVVVRAEAVKTSEVAMMGLKKKSSVMFDGISSAKMELIGDATAVEAAKRVTGVSIEGGKYVYVRGLGDRYSKTTLNGVDIPGLDPDKNSLQMDIFPTNLVNNITVSKNFTAEMPADFTGGMLDIETKDFPMEKQGSVSFGLGYNPFMHFNKNNLSYQGGKTDFLGFDDGTRALPNNANLDIIPQPFIGLPDEVVFNFVNSFNPTLEAKRKRSLMDYNFGFSLGNQLALDKKNPDSNKKLGYVFSLTYKTDYKYYSEFRNGEYQRVIDPDEYELIYATTQDGEMSERNVLIGAIGGLAYKTDKTKLKLTLMHLQSATSRAAKLFIDNSPDAVGQSGYFAGSDNLEYNQRGLSNLLLNGKHVLNKKWEVDWRVSPTISSSDDPDIRKTAFTYRTLDTLFSAGAGGNPSRIWRSLDEFSLSSKVDVEKRYNFLAGEAILKFGASHTYKNRSYEILAYDMQFTNSSSTWSNATADDVLADENIYNDPDYGIYYTSLNPNPNPNEYQSNLNNTGVYVSNESMLHKKLKMILGLRMEYFVQNHTGRDQAYASGDIVNGKVLNNEKVLESLNFFPSFNMIYNATENQNLRLAYSRTIARPSFKELSFAQILDPITNRIFNGSLFVYENPITKEVTWDGNLVETNIDNLDLRWEYFLKKGQMFSVSPFYKRFNNPIELVRIPEQQTSTEYQPRNVGTGNLYGVELEFRKNFEFISPFLKDLNLSANFTYVKSSIDMTDIEFNARKLYEKTGETIQRTRSMAGQAPYVVNVGLSYQSDELGFDAGVFYNVKGPTLEIVGAGLFPDVFTEPFHNLSMSFNKRLGQDNKHAIDFKVSNILNDRVESFYKSFEAQDQIFNSYNPGVSFSFGYKYSFF